MIPIGPRDFETQARALRCRLAGDRAILAGLRVLVALERRANFDPSQPRDDLGRWTDTGLATTYRVVDPDAKPSGASAGERVRVAGPFDWGPVDLRSKGDFNSRHNFKLHIGMTDDQLAVEAAANLSTSRAREKGEARAGTFDTIERVPMHWSTRLWRQMPTRCRPWRREQFRLRRYIWSSKPRPDARPSHPGAHRPGISSSRSKSRRGSCERRETESRSDWEPVENRGVTGWPRTYVVRPEVASGGGSPERGAKSEAGS